MRGAITSIDTTKNTITVTPANGGTAVTLAITSNTNLIGHQTIAASDIAVGDLLEVSGVPLAVQAGSIVDNKLPAPTNPTTGSGSGTGTTGTTTTGTTAPTPPVPGALRIRGTVTSLSPLTIDVDSNFSLTITGTDSTTFAEVLPVTFAQLTTGELVRAVVTKAKDGTLTALQVDVAPAPAATTGS